MKDSPYIYGAPRPGAARPEEPLLRFGRCLVDADLARLAVGLLLALVLLATALLKAPFSTVRPGLIFGQAIHYIQVEDGESLVQHLHTLGLWELAPEDQVPPVVFYNFPDDLGGFDSVIKKRIFLHAMVPTAMVALAEVEQERAHLLALLDKLGSECRLEQLLDGLKTPDQCRLQRHELEFLAGLADKYRSRRPEELLRRVNVVPVSLILAQAALESAWGSSRFTVEGNNLFGVWTWNGPGMVPYNREAGKDHKVAMYDSILESVRSYLLMLNRLPAYRALRDIRRHSMDPLALSQGLRYYSEKREEYIFDLRQMIQSNQLQRYDRLSLAPGPWPRP